MMSNSPHVEATIPATQVPSAANPAVANNNRSIGAVLMDAGRLRPEDAERVLRLAKEKHLRFGDAALQMGVITQTDLDFALARQFNFPYLTANDKGVSQEVLAAYAPTSPSAEGLRALRTQLMLRWFDNDDARHALAIVSPDQGDGRTWLTANLAVVFSQLGERTLIIDADMRTPRVHELFGMDNRGGLSGILSGRAGIETVRRVTPMPGLSVLSAGGIPPNSQELLARPAFGQLLQELSERFDVILIDTPPAADFADAQTIAVRAGGAVMVARKNISRASRLSVAAESLAQAGAVLVGSVINER